MEVRKSINVAQADEFGISWNVSEESDRVLGSEPGILEFVIPAGNIAPQAVVYGTMDLEVPLEVTGMCRIIGNPVPIIFYHPLKIICFDLLLSNVPDIALVTMKRNGASWKIPSNSSIIIGRNSKHTFGAFADSHMSSLTITRSLTVASSYIHVYGETAVSNIYSYIGCDTNLDFKLNCISESVQQMSRRVDVADKPYSHPQSKLSDLEELHPVAQVFLDHMRHIYEGDRDLGDDYRLPRISSDRQEKCMIFDKAAILVSNEAAVFSGEFGSLIYFEGESDSRRSVIQCAKLHLATQGSVVMCSKVDCSVCLECATQQETIIMKGTEITCGGDDETSELRALSLSARESIQCIDSTIRARGQTLLNAVTLVFYGVQLTSERNIIINAVTYKQKDSIIEQLSSDDTLKICASTYQNIVSSRTISRGDIRLEFVPNADQNGQDTPAEKRFINDSSRIHALKDVLLRLKFAGFGQISGHLEGGGNVRIECRNLMMENCSLIKVDGNLLLNCSKFQSSKKSRLSITGNCDISMQNGAHQLQGVFARF